MVKFKANAVTTKYKLCFKNKVLGVTKKIPLFMN